MARLSLWVRCASCGQTFDTGIRMNRRNFERATFASNYHRCPACGTRGTYGKGDYLLHVESPERRAVPPRES